MTPDSAVTACIPAVTPLGQVLAGKELWGWALLQTGPEGTLGHSPGQLLNAERAARWQGDMGAGKGDEAGALRAP